MKTRVRSSQIKQEKLIARHAIDALYQLSYDLSANAKGRGFGLGFLCPPIGASAGVRTTRRPPGNFFLFQHSYLAPYDFEPARKYEDTGPEKVAREAARRHAHQSDLAEKLARKVDQPPACDNGLVPDQKEHRDHTLAASKVLPGASYGNALKGDLRRKGCGTF